MANLFDTILSELRTIVKRIIQIDDVGCMHTKFFKAITQPIAGLTLLALKSASWCSRAIRQLPTLQPQQLQHAPLNNRLCQFQQEPQHSPSIQFQRADSVWGGDRLFFYVFQISQYRSNYQQLIDGIIYIPLIGRISVQDLTLVQVTNAIVQAYCHFLKGRIMTVKRLAPHPMNVFVSGKVNRPGYFTLNMTGKAADKPGDQYSTFTQALVKAGGLKNSRLCRSSVELIRLNLKGRIFRENVLVDFAQGSTAEKNPILRNNDIVVVSRSNTARVADALN